MKKLLVTKNAFVLFLTVFVLSIFFVSISFSVQASDDASDIRENIDSVQNKINKEQEELGKSQANLQVTQSEINITASIINKTEEEITRKEKEINNLDKRIELNKKILEGYIQEMSFEDADEPIFKFAVSGKFLDEFSSNFDSMISIKERILLLIDEIKGDKEKLGETKEELVEKKEDHEDLLNGKYAKKNQIVSQINESQLTISELQAKLNKLRSTLSKFLGESYDMDDVIDAVKLADKKTGVRKEFLFAMLDKESDLGRFTGGCSYKESKITKRSDDNFEDLKKITKELGYDYKKVKLSCPASSGGTGGAMGIAQFMPSTWMGYKNSIAAKTGHKPADPWRLEDGITGMALKLKKAGGDKKSGEHSAAMIYYCGSDHPTETYPGRVASCNNYADTVISWSKGYDDYF